MNKNEHRLGVSEVNLVGRRLRLLECDEQALENAIAEIDEIYGIDLVSFDAKKSSLILAYDATRTCIDCIEEILQKHKIEVSPNWWTQFREGFYRHVDQNVKDNATHEPFSCHKIAPHK